jgi:hypothetical protein
MVKLYFFYFKLNKKNRSSLTNGEIVFFYKKKLRDKKCIKQKKRKK